MSLSLSHAQTCTGCGRGGGTSHQPRGAPTQGGRQPCPALLCPAMLSACQTPFNPPSHYPTLRRCPCRVVRAIFKGRVKHDRALAVQPCWPQGRTSTSSSSRRSNRMQRHIAISLQLSALRLAASALQLIDESGCTLQRISARQRVDGVVGIAPAPAPAPAPAKQQYIIAHRDPKGATRMFVHSCRCLGVRLGGA